MEIYALLLPLAAAACMPSPPAPDGQTLSSDEIACTLEGESFAGISAESACAIFRRVMAERLGRSDSQSDYRIELGAKSPERASAVVRDAKGAVLVAMEHAVMDAALTRSAWENFAQAVASELARKQAS